MKNSHKFKLLGSEFSLPPVTSGIMQYSLAVIIVTACAGVCFFFTDYIGYRSVSFILLFTVSIMSIFMGIGPIILAAALSAIIWNFFFIPPKFTIDIDRTEDALMLTMFFIIALVNSILTSRIRKQERLTRSREEHTNALYQLTKDLSTASGLDELIEAVVRNIKINFGSEAIIILQDGNGKLMEYSTANAPKKLTSGELGVAESVFRQSGATGRQTGITGSSDYIYYPLIGNNVRPGVLVVKSTASAKDNDVDFRETFLTQVSNAIERQMLNDLAVKARLLDESDKLYKTLFNSISHELRIPIATIMSASESLLTVQHPDEIRKELSSEILKGSTRLNRLVENLLNMSRLESGHLTLKPDWYDIHDLVNKVVGSLREELRPFDLIVTVEDEMPLVRIDFGLMEQVLYNIIYNVTQIATVPSNLEIKASYREKSMILEILDRGPGLPDREIPFIFNKFYRLEGSKAGGTGLGLSIAKGFTEAHKGTITAENREDGGAKFTIRIPSDKPCLEIS